MELTLAHVKRRVARLARGLRLESRDRRRAPDESLGAAAAALWKNRRQPVH